MSAEQATQAKTAAGSLGPCESVIIGRIDNTKKFEGNWYSRIIIPAVDAYSRPDTVEVQSKESLGEVGGEARVRVRIGGFKNDFEANGVKVKSARVLLRAVENQ